MKCDLKKRFVIKGGKSCLFIRDRGKYVIVVDWYRYIGNCWKFKEYER